MRLLRLICRIFGHVEVPTTPWLFAATVVFPHAVGRNVECLRCGAQSGEWRSYPRRSQMLYEHPHMVVPDGQ